MSNALAMASVSFVLVDLLNNGLIDQDISATLGNDILVTSEAPDRVDQTQQSIEAKSQLNLFLYNVTQNQGWRNVGYPSRNKDGDRIDNPPLALNFHYLLTAYGVKQFHAEILLGYGMQLFHESPFLARDAIRKSLSAPSQVTPNIGLAPYMSNLFTSELAEQVEMIKIWPETLSTEEISRLWTAFQAKYRPTAAYQVSVVLIQSRAATITALPVATRNVQAITLKRPTVNSVLSQKTLASPPDPNQMILPGYTLLLLGTQLQGQNTTVGISGVEVVPAANMVKPTSIAVAMPSTLLPGIQSVIVKQSVTYASNGGMYPTFESTPVSFLLHPVIQTVVVSGVTGSGDVPRSGDLLITVNPAIGPEQEVHIILNQYLPGSPPSNSISYTFEVPPRIALQSPPLSLPAPSPNLQVAFSGVMAGNYVIRVTVDNADSPLSTDAEGFFAQPQVTIP